MLGVTEADYIQATTIFTKITPAQKSNDVSNITAFSATYQKSTNTFGTQPDQSIANYNFFQIPN